MSLLTKAVVIVLFYSFVVAIIALLPSVQDYPLSPAFASSLAVIFGYLFAWSSVFTCINSLLSIALISIGLELAIWIWQVNQWVINFTARLIA